MANEQNINMDKNLCLSHTFHLLLGAGRAALLPFLSLYLRLLGLSATQTGLVFGARAFMATICTPAWTTCAKRFNKKKIVMMFSLFMMLVMYLSMCLIPPADKHVPLAFCRLGFKNGSDIEADLGPAEPLLNGSIAEGVTGSQSEAVSTVRITQTSTPGGNEIDKSSGQVSKSPGEKAQEETPRSSSTTASTTSTTTTTTEPTSTASSTTRRSTTSTTTSTSTSTTRPTIPTESYTNWEMPNQDASRGQDRERTPPDNNGDNLSDDDLRTLLNYLSKEDLDGLTQKDLNTLLEQISDLDNKPNGNKHSKRSLIQSVRNKWDELSSRFELAEYQTFVFCLMLFIVGELFAAPYEKLANDCWFEYLDILDSLERFGGHRVWQTVGFVVIPTMIAAVVDHTPCMLSLGIHHFLLHFLVFAVLIALAFLLALCYPVSQHKQTAKKSRFGKGLRVLCGDARAFSMSFTMVIVGISSAVIANFLFWRVQDLGGPELTMGVCVAVAAGSEFVIRLIGPSLVRRFTHAVSVILALLMLVGILIFYAVLPSPWLAVCGAVFHGLATTLLWISMQTYPDFRINPFVMDRSAASLINSLHVGVGFSIGSMVSGIIYDKLGHMILYLGTAGLTGAWMLIFTAIQRFSKKTEKVRYAKLLQDENMDDSDESTVYEDDWLEVAMKRDR